MQGPMPPAPENTSQLTIREATEPAAASTTPCSPSGAVVVSAEATPTPEAPSGLVVGLADASQPATGSVPDEDVDMDEASDDAAYGIKRLNDMGDITLYQMPNCTCILGSDAVLKYMDWVAANLSEDAVPTCPVQGCGTPLNVSSRPRSMIFKADHLTSHRHSMITLSRTRPLPLPIPLHHW